MGFLPMTHHKDLALLGQKDEGWGSGCGTWGNKQNSLERDNI